MEINPPCFDPKTRQDCPRRHGGCAATCPDWAEYEKKREERYQAKAQHNGNNTDFVAVRMHNFEKKKLFRRKYK